MRFDPAPRPGDPRPSRTCASRRWPWARAQAGVVGAVYGHPGGGPLRAAPARIAEEIDARGTDIYRTTATSRDVFVLAAQLAPGDSGAPLVDQAGQRASASRSRSTRAARAPRTR